MRSSSLFGFTDAASKASGWPNAVAAARRQKKTLMAFRRTRVSLSCILGCCLLGRRETTGPGRFTDDVSVHGFQQFVAGGGGREIQFCIERVELEYIMMDRTRGCARSEIARRTA